MIIEWMLSGDGTCELLPICRYRYDCGILPVCIQTHGDLIVVGDLIKSISLLLYKVRKQYNTVYLFGYIAFEDKIFFPWRLNNFALLYQNIVFRFSVNVLCLQFF